MTLWRQSETLRMKMRNEEGFALLMTVFVISLLTLLVTSFMQETFSYQRTSRAFVERIEADYMLKSALNFAKVLLQLPKEEGVQEDWLGEPWALVGSLPSIPVPGFQGELRVMIVDDSSKINLNAILGTQVGFPGGGVGGGSPGSGLQEDPVANFWKNVLSELFKEAQFTRASYASNEARTLGDRSFEPQEQVGVIHDWLDINTESHSSGTFPGDGIESSSPKTWFFNRQFRNVSELVLVPGMTRERVQYIAPFVRVAQPSQNRINVNTAPSQVLLALGFPESEVSDIIQKRQSTPIDGELLQTLVEGSLQLGQVVTTRSTEYTAYARVVTANVTRWARGSFTVQGGQNRRVASLRSLEMM